MGTGNMGRRVTALAFSADGTHVVVAEKTGDAFNVAVANAMVPGAPFLGRISTLLGVVQNKKKKTNKQTNKQTGSFASL